MASISKRNNTWRVQICIKGERDSGTFTTKAQAVAWAAQREAELRGQENGALPNKTCGEAFERYEKEVSAGKRGHRWEAMRLHNFTNFPIRGKTLGKILLKNADAALISEWRDIRLEQVSGATVKREMNLMAHVFSIARSEWKWINHTPTKDVRRPKDAPPRDRRISEGEIKLICFSLGFDYENPEPVKMKLQAVAVAFLFAIETAMRAGEICSLRRENVSGNVAHLPMTKNGLKRDVPLSPQALRLLSLLPENQNPIFGLKSDSLSTLFSKAVERCMIENLTFHDSRHEAITRLAKIFNVLELARVVGHRDLKMLQIYFNATPQELASRFS